MSGEERYHKHGPSSDPVDVERRALALTAAHRAGAHDGDEPHADCWYCERQAADFEEARR